MEFVVPVEVDEWHDGVPFDPIQGRGQGHEISNIRIFLKVYFPIYNGSWQTTADS